MSAIFEQARVVGSKFTNALMMATNFRRSSAYGCVFANTRANNADFRSAELAESDFESATLFDTRFDLCDLERVKFRRSSMSGANIRGARLGSADFSDADVTSIAYMALGLWPFRAHSMLGRYLGIRGIESCYGNPQFRRDAIDQDFIDARYDAVRLNRRAVFQSIQRLPGRLLFGAWGFFDYGRSLSALFVFAAVTISIFGYWFQQLANEGYITFTGSLATTNIHNQIVEALNPWFAAFIGFVTLGISDIVRPSHWLGQLAMALNIAAGFITLGLFIAVFQNIFARRG